MKYDTFDLGRHSFLFCLHIRQVSIAAERHSALHADMAVVQLARLQCISSELGAHIDGAICWLNDCRSQPFLFATRGTTVSENLVTPRLADFKMR